MLFRHHSAKRSIMEEEPAVTPMQQQHGIYDTTLLSDEIWFLIFSMFPPNDLCKVASVCGDWARLSNDDELWKVCWLHLYQEIHQTKVAVLKVYPETIFSIFISESLPNSMAVGNRHFKGEANQRRFKNHRRW